MVYLSAHNPWSRTPYRKKEAGCQFVTSGGPRVRDPSLSIARTEESDSSVLDSRANPLS
jgi:hypothetical protein